MTTQEMLAQETLAKAFEAKRSHLQAVAFRMLGSTSEADDAVQDAWLKVSRASMDDVDNLGGWMTTIVARVCLDMLRSRSSRREDPKGSHLAFEKHADAGPAPDRETLLADSIGIALLVVLETLAPAERVAFVLHDMFDLSYGEIAPIVDRSPAAARQLASRARHRVNGAPPDVDADVAVHQKIVEAFLAASRDGNLAALLAVLDPDVVVTADALAVAQAARNPGAPKLAPERRGADAVVDTFLGKAKAAQVALVDGVVAAIWAHAGKTRAVFSITIKNEKICNIDMICEPDRLREFEVDILVSANPG